MNASSPVIQADGMSRVQMSLNENKVSVVVKNIGQHAAA